MTDVAIKSLSWTGGLVGVEPRPAPTFDEPPPDADAIRARAAQTAQEWITRGATAKAVLERITPTVTIAGLSVVVGAVLLLALGVGFASNGVDALYANADREEGTPSGLAYALIGGALLGTFAAASWQKLRKPHKRLGFWKGVLLFVVVFFAGFALVGFGMAAFPLAIGLLALRSRPLLWWQNGSQVQVDPSLWRMFREERSIRAQADEATARAGAEAERQVAEELAAFNKRRKEFADDLARWSPFAPVGPLADRDLIVVGGSAAERGDLVHNLAAAWSLAGPVWILDVHADGASATVCDEAPRNGRRVGVLNAGDGDGLVALLDGLGHSNGRRSPLVEVLSSGMAAGSETSSVGRKREIADMLRRIGGVVSEGREQLRVADFHRAVEALLGGRTAAAAVTDDFGLADGGGDPAAGRRFTADETRRLREEFTDDERNSFFREWSDIRTKLRLMLGDDDAEGELQWGRGCAVSCAFISGDVPRDERELRSALLVEHHVQLLRRGGENVPACLIVIGADDVGEEGLKELTKVTEAAGVALALVFADLTPEARQLARGRRALAAFGGLGAEAAEELSNVFGQEWIPRVKSYQETLSVSQAESRSRTVGRSWGGSESYSETDSVNEGWSEGSTDTHSADSGGSWSTNKGKSGGTSRSKSWSDSTNWSENESETGGTTDTTGESWATTREIEYAQSVRGSEIARLTPYVMVLKVGPAVIAVDVDRDLVLPGTFLDQFRPLELRRRAPARRAGPVPAAPTAQEPAELPAPG
jgi:prepilin signal peptidase PulO-like enzyme (type II secretory pathway)